MLLRNKKLAIGVAIALIILAGVTSFVFDGKDTDSSGPAVFQARRGPLSISVIESGTIRAREQIIIKNELEGRTSILYLISEGTIVQKGELLVELDASSLEDSKIDQEIMTQNAEASYINSQENLAVVKNQVQSDMDLAELSLEFAGQDLKKYIDGEYPNELQQAEADITLAQEELARARETLKWSQTLYEEKYISQTELQADQLMEKKKSLDLQLAINNRDLLTNYTYHRNIAQLESDVSQASMALERTNRKAKADVIQAEAELKAREAEYRRQEDKLKKLEGQIAKTKIYAPADGLVIYATSARTGGWRSSVEPLEEGRDVHERQELIYLPTAHLSKAEVAIHESNLEKIHVGQPAVITVDALPGKRFAGTVATIAPLPNAQSMWMNPDLKVYTTEIYLQNNQTSLKTGMSCQAEILIEQYDDALYVPIQAVMRVGGKHVVYVMKGEKFEPVAVQAGLDNNRMIHITDGLKDGQVVLLTPPLKAAEMNRMDVATVEKEPIAPDGERAESIKTVDFEAAPSFGSQAAQEENGAGAAGRRPADTQGRQRGGRRRDRNNIPPQGQGGTPRQPGQTDASKQKEF